MDVEEAVARATALVHGIKMQTQQTTAECATCRRGNSKGAATSSRRAARESGAVEAVAGAATSRATDDSRRSVDPRRRHPGTTSDAAMRGGA